MKKHLIALAVAGAVAVPAMAQNATIYGTIEQNLKNDSTSTTHEEALLATSVIGVKGSEDLGGGLKAGFQLTVDFLPSGAAYSKTSESSLNIGSAAMGTVKFGTTDTSGVQGIDSMSSPIGNMSLAVIAQLGKDKADTINYTTPTMNGFSAQVGYTNATADITSVFVQYAANGVTIKAGRTTEEATGADQTDTEYGIQFPAGPATVGVTYHEAVRTTAAEGGKSYQIGVGVPVGNGITLGAAYNNTNLNSTGTDTTRTTLVAKKDLSKRTSVYAAYKKVSDADANTYVGVVHTF
jgi:predicted porin